MIFENMIQDHKLLIRHYYSFFAGIHGTGKLTLVQATIRQLIKRKQNVLIACPTGHLALTYSVRLRFFKL